MPPHQPESQTENLAEKLQALARKHKPSGTRNADPDSNSGYPAGGQETPPGQDAYEKPTDDEQRP